MSEVHVTNPKFNNVDTDHPSIRDTAKRLAKMGVTKDKAMRIVGMPAEVIDRHYQEAAREAARDKKK